MVPRVRVSSHQLGCTALFNVLFARATAGLHTPHEDTDQNRYVEDSVEDIKESLRWLGLWTKAPMSGSVGSCSHNEWTYTLVRRGLS